MNNFISEFVDMELGELESRDIDTLYECIEENLQDMLQRELTESEQDELYSTLEYKLNKENGE